MGAFTQVIMSETSAAPTTGGGLLTGIALALPISIFAITGSPALDGGTLTATLQTQTANYVFAGPAAGAAAAPAFRALVAADIPALSYGVGSVTSVALTIGGGLFSISGSPVTGAGTLAATLATQAANKVFAGPTTGSAAAPTMRSLVAADLPSIPDNSLFANTSGGSAAPTAQTLWAFLDYVFGTTQGSVLYRNGSSWVSLGPGSAGQVLKSGGAGANPSWGALGSYAEGTSFPGSPTVGDYFLRTDLGIAFRYFNDGNSTQWVEW